MSPIASLPDELQTPSAPVSAPQKSLKSRAIRASAWTMVGYGGGQLLRVASTLILTRLLFPEIYGKMAIVNVFFQGLQMFSDVGVGQSIIQHANGEDPNFYNTAWTIQIIRGAAVFICGVLLSWPLAMIYGQPDLKIILPIITFTALIGGFNSTALYSLSRNVQLKKLTLLDLATQIVLISTTVTWAFFNRSVWAFVAAAVASSVFRMVCSHSLLSRYRNRLHWDRQCTHALFKFGRWIFISTALTFFSGEADRIIYSVKIPLAMMGVYQIAMNLADVPSLAMIRIVGPVAFSVYCRMGDQSSTSLGSIFGRLRMPLLVIAGWAVTGLLAVGPSLIHVMYDPRYAAAGWILQMLMINAWFEILETTNGSALLAMAKPSWVAAGNAAKLIGISVFVSLGFYIGGKYGHAFPGAMIGMILSETLRYSTTAIAIHMQGFGVFLRDMAVTLLVGVTAAMALAIEYYLGKAYPGSLIPAVAAAACVCAIWAPLAYRSYRVIFPAKRREVESVALAHVEAA